MPWRIRHRRAWAERHAWLLASGTFVAGVAIGAGLMFAACLVGFGR